MTLRVIKLRLRAALALSALWACGAACPTLALAQSCGELFNRLEDRWGAMTLREQAELLKGIRQGLIHRPEELTGFLERLANPEDPLSQPGFMKEPLMRETAQALLKPPSYLADIHLDPNAHWRKQEQALIRALQMNRLPVSHGDRQQVELFLKSSREPLREAARKLLGLEAPKRPEPEEPAPWSPETTTDSTFPESSRYPEIREFLDYQAEVKRHRSPAERESYLRMFADELEQHLREMDIGFEREGDQFVLTRLYNVHRLADFQSTLQSYRATRHTRLIIDPASSLEHRENLYDPIRDAVIVDMAFFAEPALQDWRLVRIHGLLPLILADKSIVDRGRTDSKSFAYLGTLEKDGKRTSIDQIASLELVTQRYWAEMIKANNDSSRASQLPLLADAFKRDVLTGYELANRAFNAASQAMRLKSPIELDLSGTVPIATLACEGSSVTLKLPLVEPISPKNPHQTELVVLVQLARLENATNMSFQYFRSAIDFIDSFVAATTQSQRAELLHKFRESNEHSFFEFPGGSRPEESP